MLINKTKLKYESHLRILLKKGKKGKVREKVLQQYLVAMFEGEKDAWCDVMVVHEEDLEEGNKNIYYAE